MVCFQLYIILEFLYLFIPKEIHLSWVSLTVSIRGSPVLHQTFIKFKCGEKREFQSFHQPRIEQIKNKIFTKGPVPSSHLTWSCLHSNSFKKKKKKEHSNRCVLFSSKPSNCPTCPKTSLNKSKKCSYKRKEDKLLPRKSKSFRSHKGTPNSQNPEKVSKY